MNLVEKSSFSNDRASPKSAILAVKARLFGSIFLSMKMLVRSLQGLQVAVDDRNFKFVEELHA